MARKRFAAYRDNAIALYNAGLSYAKIGEELGIPSTTIASGLKGFIVPRKPSTYTAARKREERDRIAPIVVNLFQDGVSVKAIASKLSIQRSTVYKVLKDQGIQARNRSEAMHQRWSNMSPSEREATVAAAHAATKGKKQPPEWGIKQAIAKQLSQSKVGKHEREFTEYAIAQGLMPIPQKAVGCYNIDIAIGNVAVEIHSSCTNPNNIPRLVERTEYLLNAGWHLIYVWPTRSDNGDISRSFQDVVSFFYESQRLPPSVREYRVIRSTGELASARRVHLD